MQIKRDQSYNRRLDYFKQQQYEADTEAKLLDAKILEEEIKSKPDFELKSGYVNRNCRICHSLFEQRRKDLCGY